MEWMAMELNAPFNEFRFKMATLFRCELFLRGHFILLE